MKIPVRSSFTVNGINERPAVNGLYAAEIYFGWKLLDWKDGEWRHTGGTGRWMAGDVVQWVGPLPERRGMPPKQEFDL